MFKGIQLAIHKNDIISLALLVQGLSTAVAIGTPAADALDSISGSHGKIILSGLAIAGIVASQVLRVLNAPAGGTAPANPTSAPTGQENK